MSKRKDLINSYDSFKKNSFYGIGQRKAKLFMNSLQKELDAQISITPDDVVLIKRRDTLLFLRNILECENCNINAKKYFNTDGFSYQDHNYNRKHALVKELLTVAPRIGISYGYAESNDPATKYIVYFDMPLTGDQVSFHSDIDKDRLDSVPVYNKEWDQLVNSSLKKIEKSFCLIFGDELKHKYKIETKDSNSTCKETEQRNTPNWGIARREDRRYVIIDAISHNILYAGRHGFRSYNSAYNYGFKQYHTEAVNCTEEKH